MRDAARLLAYLGAILLLGALGAPLLFWLSRWLAANGLFTFLLQFDFQTFFHRALLIAALLLMWPLLKALRLRSKNDLGLTPNDRWARDLCAGIAIAAVPLSCAGAAIVAAKLYVVRPTVNWGDIATVAVSAAVVPLIEEALFRGLILGVLLRRWRPPIAMVVTSAFFSVVHFLKAPPGTSTEPHWHSGFVSIVNAFAQFREPMLVLAGFTTLFLIGYILADARVRTRSLWLPIGLHAGWIFSNGLFSRLTHRQAVIMPWLGKNLLVGIVPLCVALFTWWIMHLWFRRTNQ